MLSSLSSKQEWRRDVKWEPFASLTFTPFMLHEPSCMVFVVRNCSCVLKIRIWSLAHASWADTVEVTWRALWNLWRDHTFCPQVGTVLKGKVSLGKEQNPPFSWLRDMLMLPANAHVSADCLDSFGNSAFVSYDALCLQRLCWSPTRTFSVAWLSQSDQKL